MREITRPTCMEISIYNFIYNINEIKKYVGDGINIMPVIKANAYGTYMNTQLDVLNVFDIVAVATVDEGVYLREIGYQKEIFILNQPYLTEIQKIIDYNLVPGVSSEDFAKALGDTNKEVKVHVEFGTGMGRTGINPQRAEEYINSLAENIIVEGIYTHFSSADSDDEYTKSQLQSFNTAVEKAKQICPKLKYIHAAASNAILNYPDSYFNLVRPGIIMYGYPASETTLEKIDIKPVAKLKSKITFLKTVKEGTSIGYNRSFITNKETKVATVPIGYADGFRRTFSNNGEVLINGKLVPIIGKICMDSFMCDVSSLDDVKIGDEVYIWDNDKIKLEDLANKCDTINYEILSQISNRVPRLFV
ncbi:MAG: alanine racemase [Clostridia bacterium]|nr:alanine racemase [Clostridia bacterium]